MSRINIGLTLQLKDARLSLVADFYRSWRAATGPKCVKFFVKIDVPINLKFIGTSAEARFLVRCWAPVTFENVFTQSWRKGVSQMHLGNQRRFSGLLKLMSSVLLIMLWATARNWLLPVSFCTVKIRFRLDRTITKAIQHESTSFVKYLSRRHKLVRWGWYRGYESTTKFGLIVLKAFKISSC